MSKVTLVYPGIGHWGFNANRAGEFNWINHGLALIGAYLKSKGYQVNLIDMRRCKGWSDFKMDIIDNKSDYFGISISYLDTEVAEEAIGYMKTLSPNSKIIVGGLAPTLFPDRFISNLAIDHIVTNEGELAVNEIVSGKASDRVIKGLKPDINLIPYADRELYTYIYELACSFAPTQPKPSITMISGRGCPYQCTFCQPAESKVFGHNTRMRSVDNVIQELVELKNRYHYKSITWWDDTFTFNKNWVEEFCAKYRHACIGADMVACSRADIICKNEHMVKRLAQAGLTWFVIGFESGNQRILDFLKKGTTVEQNLASARICRKYGIKVFGTFMVGLPTETKSEQADTFNLIRTINPDHRSLFYFTPIPGTDIYDYCKENGLILRKDKLNIERTDNYTPKIRNIDYTYLDSFRILMKGEEKCLETQIMEARG